MAKISNNKENEPVVENGKKKKEEKPATKVVVRRLPPTMTEEQFKMQVSPLPDNDYFYYVPADMSLMPNAFCRAYINFINQSDLFIFTQKFDGYVFLDSKGGEFPAVVEFAPFQRIPKNRPHRRKDPKTGTIELDPVFLKFKERLEAQTLENKAATNASKQHFFETSLLPEKKETNNTPLIDFIKNKRAERQRIRDEKREEKRKKDLERRKAKEELRRTKKEDETSVVKVLNSNQNGSKERVKEKEVKQSFPKKKLDDTKIAKERSGESRPKDSKIRAGKSYLEERQRQAERREEQRKKLSQSQSTNSLSEVKLLTSEESVIDLNGDKSSEDKHVIEHKIKDTDYKKTERNYKREETKKSSYKYESKRDKDTDDSRRVRRANERSHQSTRKDEERPEDGGRKRYSESRRNHESTHRDKYKEKDKSKNYNLKKHLNSSSDTEKTKSTSESYGKSLTGDIQESYSKDELEIKKIIDKAPESTDQREDIKYVELKQVNICEENNENKPTRRKSLDERNRSPSANVYGKIYGKEKYAERKRRNSVGSSKNNEANVENSTSQFYKEFSRTRWIAEKETFLSEESKSSELESKISLTENKTKKKTVHESIEIPKRRNSTGERHNAEKYSPRRNSLGSEDKDQGGTFNNQLDSDVKSGESKSKDGKKLQDGRDPRVERKIRNKDRPSREIYRPGMGKFSKQRMEREKCLGSSTEVESPSSSPSPTPILKHKTTTSH